MGMDLCYKLSPVGSELSVRYSGMLAWAVRKVIEENHGPKVWESMIQDSFIKLTKKDMVDVVAEMGMRLGRTKPYENGNIRGDLLLDMQQGAQKCYALMELLHYCPDQQEFVFA